MKSNKVSRRRWFRFRLRTLLGGILCIAVVVGFCVERARRQKQAFARLNETGFYSMQYVDPRAGDGACEHRFLSRCPPELVGYDWFSGELLVTVNNIDHRISNDEIIALRRLPKLRRLIYTAENDDVERLRVALPHCEVVPLTISHRFQLDVF
jgi:hypothetical protein